MTNEELFKNIDLLQACIERMAKNSFQVKGWCFSFSLAMIAGLFKLDAPNWTILLVSFPVLVFWYIDAFFLKEEKCYRRMYECLIGVREKPKNWVQYDLNPRRYLEELGDSMWSTIMTKTLFPFYLVQILIVGAIWLIMRFK